MEAIAARRRLHTHVVEALVPMIASGELPPGSLLPTEPEMSARFGVSRSVVREALRVLDAKGLIEVRHGSGTRVTSPDRWDPLDPQLLQRLPAGGPSARVLQDLLETRTIVECAAAALAAERADASDCEALESALRTMRAALDDPTAFVEGDSAFHLTLLRAARNRVLERLTQPMHGLLSYAQQLTDAIPGVLGRALRQHEVIADAVRRRDAGAAREAMRVHLAQTQRDIIAITEAR
ncbi:MAG TPA: FadR/GntR family transcriptional regulator [Candidatus Elarobacter sp.]|jgi:DNA-binding FadR family transcriptional regulator|nr:FadR/GntR family transcriptional regulator [Candidatus Elarobacter sp.]